MVRDKKRICLALSNVNAEDAIMNIVNTKFSSQYEIVKNVRSKEALISAITQEKYDTVILREDLTGNIDIIDLFKEMRARDEEQQIIFFMNSRDNGDPFYIEMFLFGIYDFVVLPDIKLDDIFSFLARPRHFKDIIRFLPTRAERIRNLIVSANKEMKAPPKMNEDGDIDEIFTINLGSTLRREQTRNGYGQVPPARYIPKSASEYYGMKNTVPKENTQIAKEKPIQEKNKPSDEVSPTPQEQKEEPKKETPKISFEEAFQEVKQEISEEKLAKPLSIATTEIEEDDA